VEWFYNTSTLPINFFSKFSLAFMAQLWVLGDRFLIEFQNYISKIIVYKMEAPPKVDEFDQYIKIADHYAEGDNPLIKIAVCRMASINVPTFDLWAPKVPRRILDKVAGDLKRRLGILAVSKQPVFGMSDDFRVKRKPTKSQLILSGALPPYPDGY